MPALYFERIQQYEDAKTNYSHDYKDQVYDVSSDQADETSDNITQAHSLLVFIGYVPVNLRS